MKLGSAVKRDEMDMIDKITSYSHEILIPCQFYSTSDAKVN